MSEVRVDNITGETGTDAVKFTKGITVTGIATVGNVSVGSSLTAVTFFGNGAGVTNVIAGQLLKRTAYTITRQSISHAAWPTMILFHKLQRELSSFLRHTHQATILAIY